MPYRKAEGRFIIGVGQGSLRAPLHVEQTGGKEMVTLGIVNMPAHQHGTIIHASSEEGEKRENKKRGWGNEKQINPAPKTTMGTGDWESDGGFFLTSPVGHG